MRSTGCTITAEQKDALRQAWGHRRVGHLLLAEEEGGGGARARGGGAAAAARKPLLPDELVQDLCARITDKDILSKLQPVIQGLVHNRLTRVRFVALRIDWKTAAGLEAAAALAAAMASSSSLTVADLESEWADRIVAWYV